MVQITCKNDRCHRPIQFVWNLQQASCHSTPFSLSKSISQCMSKSDRIIELFILAFNEYLLNVYYVSGAVLGAGSKIVNRSGKAHAVWQLHYCSEKSFLRIYIQINTH